MSSGEERTGSGGERKKWLGGERERNRGRETSDMEGGRKLSGEIKVDCRW